jgi:hypothetical protein
MTSLPALPASDDHRPVARISTPAELAATVPLLCGFVPDESLVVVCLRRPRRRVGLTMRIDLPPPDLADATEHLVTQMVERARFDGAASVAFVVYTEVDAPGVPGRLPRSDLADRVVDAMSAVGIDVTERLLVRDGRWWSYGCSGTCCPPEGTPLSAQPSGSVALLAAAQVLDGRAVLPSRSDLVASLDPPTEPRTRRELSAGLASAVAARRRRVGSEGRVAVGRDALLLWRRNVERILDDPAGPAPETAAVLAVSLDDVLVRDEVLTWAQTEAEPLLALLLRLVRLTPAPHDVAPCTLLGWVAHATGDGALANVALDRALASDPDYGAATLCRDALDAQVPPAAVLSLLADAQTVLRQQHPWTGCHER